MKLELFWYYLKSFEKAPKVHEEDRQPCAAIDNQSEKNLLFDVSYFRNRINPSILMLPALIVFEGKNMLQELTKRFHVFSTDPLFSIQEQLGES
jgi:hypothetical protein